jgi:hypothetical protein
MAITIYAVDPDPDTVIVLENSKVDFAIWEKVHTFLRDII